MIIRISLATLALLLALVPQSASAQTAPLALGLAPLANKSQNQNLDVVALLAGSSIDLSLRLLGSFRMSPVMAADQAAARAAAEREGLAGVLFGAVEEAPDGSIKLSVALFDRLKDALSHNQTETAATLLDVFEASDQLTARLVEALAGRKVGFGTLELALTPPGAVGLSVLLNGTPLSLAEGRLPPIPAGDYQLELRQKRFGKNVSLLKQALTVKENQRSAVALAVPELTEEERAAFRAFDREIMELIPRKPEEALKRLSTMADAAGTESHSRFAESFKRKYGQWADRIVRGKYSPDLAAETATDLAFMLFGVLNQAELRSFPNRLEFLPPIAPAIPLARIKVDGRQIEWGDQGRLKARNTPATRQPNPAHELVAIHGMRDESKYFIRIDNKSRIWDRECNVGISGNLLQTSLRSAAFEFLIKIRPGRSTELLSVEMRGRNVVHSAVQASIEVGDCIEIGLSVGQLGDPWLVSIVSATVHAPARPGDTEKDWQLVDAL